MILYFLRWNNYKKNDQTYSFSINKLALSFHDQSQPSIAKRQFLGNLISHLKAYLYQQIQQMNESRLSERSSSSANALPRKEEWALINQHRALQYERGRSMEKLLSQQKKDNFKRQLDQQLQQKHNLRKDEKAQDRKHYDYIMQKAQEMKEKEERQKFQKFVLSKQMQEDNKRKFESYSNPKFDDYGKVYNIDIGIKSAEQKQKRAEQIRKDVIQSVQKQLQIKDAERRAQKELDLIQRQKNQQYQEQLEHRKYREKRYEQNEKVYNYYRQLYQQKMRKDKQLEHKFVDEVQQTKLQEEQRKKQIENIQKQKRNIEMRDTLQQQLQLLNYKKQEEFKVNPEQANYSFISNIFRDKRPSFDKQEYSKFLEKQAEEQRLNKLQQRYMSQEQYRYNSNQISKAINGNYTFDRYQDRSMATLGDKLNMSASASIQPMNTQDAQLVKTKLEVARSHHRPRLLDRSGQLNPII